MPQPTRSATELSLGEQLAHALAAQDAPRLRALFATPLTFRAVTPRRFWDAETAVEVVDDIMLGTWFGSGVTVTGIDELESDEVADVHKVRYRLSVERDAGRAVLEQVAYYSVSDGLISDIRLVCSGFRPV